MIDVIVQWAGNGFTLLGSWVLAKKKKPCLILYSIGNMFWMGYSIYSHLWSLTTLEVMLTLLNVRAWIQWGK